MRREGDPRSNGILVVALGVFSVSKACWWEDIVCSSAEGGCVMSGKDALLLLVSGSKSLCSKLSSFAGVPRRDVAALRFDTSSCR